MSGYDTPQCEQAARLLQLAHDLSHEDREEQLGTSAATTPSGSGCRVDGASIVDVLLDRLAERVAAAVVAQIGSGVVNPTDDWLDSRQAAEYLGLHRDTLRRLAAARAISSEQNGHGCKLFFRRAALDEWRRSGRRSGHLAAVANAA